MKYLCFALLLIALYETIKHLHKKYYKNWKNKYFCKGVCDDIMFKNPFQERVFYDAFFIDVGHNNTYTIVLGSQSVAAWTYINGSIDNLCVYNEELFKTFKEKYILENN